MSLYEHLAPVYDELFPVNPETIAFLVRLLEGRTAEARILDLGAATGGHALALARLGASVTALEPSTELAAIARRRVAADNLRLSLIEDDLRRIDRLVPRASFDLVLCLGNTLPHLSNLEEVEAFLGSASRILKPGGSLVIQLVNYSLIGPGHSFPEIKSGSTVFKRTYVEAGSGRLGFDTELDLGDGGLFSDRTELFPIFPDALAEASSKAGFRQIRCFSSWEGGDFVITKNPFLILVAEIFDGLTPI